MSTVPSLAGIVSLTMPVILPVLVTGRLDARSGNSVSLKICHVERRVV